MDEEEKKLRRQQQEVLNAADGGEPYSLMYSQLLQNYENVKDDYALLRKRYDDLVASHSAAISKLERSEVSKSFNILVDTEMNRNFQNLEYLEGLNVFLA